MKGWHLQTQGAVAPSGDSTVSYTACAGLWDGAWLGTWQS